MINTILKNFCLITFALIAPITLPAGGIQKSLNKNIVPDNPKVLPSKIIIIELKSKIYIFIQPFKILLGSSINLLEGNSTLTQVSLLLTFQFRNTDKLVPTSRTNNSLA